MIMSETSVFDDGDVAKILNRYIDNSVTFGHIMGRIPQLVLGRSPISSKTGTVNTIGKSRN